MDDFKKDNRKDVPIPSHDYQEEEDDYKFTYEDYYFDREID